MYVVLFQGAQRQNFIVRVIFHQQNAQRELFREARIGFLARRANRNPHGLFGEQAHQRVAQIRWLDGFRMQPDAISAGVFCDRRQPLIAAAERAQHQQRRTSADALHVVKRKIGDIVIHNGNVETGIGARSHRLFNRGVDERQHFPRFQMLQQNVPGIRIGIDHDGALAVQVRVVDVEFARGAHADGLNRDREMESRAHTDFALDPHLAAHQFGKMSANCQPQARPAETPRAGSIRLLERLENVFEFVLRYADARVLHREVDFPVVLFQPAAGSGEQNTASRRKFYGIAEQVDQDLAQPGDVAEQRFGHTRVEQIRHVHRLPGGAGGDQI